MSRYLKERDAAVRVYLNNALNAGMTGDNLLPNSPAGVGASVKPAGGAGPDNDELVLRPKEEGRDEKVAGLLEGVGSRMVYPNLASARVNHMWHISDTEAVNMCHYVLRRDGFFLGGSSGLQLVGAYLTALHMGPGKRILTLACDGGVAYQDRLYRKEWLAERNIEVGPVPQCRCQLELASFPNPLPCVLALACIQPPSLPTLFPSSSSIFRTALAQRTLWSAWRNGGDI